ncbi:MAG: type II secretion system F family protein, partial [Candidatus Parcubacteria bacterium]|nr:type II secretion system F family protein [Candidatus Parcubacteria bacterium]
MFTRNLQVMVSAGIALPRSLKTLSGQTKNEKFKDALNKISDKVVKGNSFSESLKDHSDIFPEFFYSMVKVGEESGTLEDVLKNLINQMEKEYALKAKIIGALIYPSVIISAMVGIGILMMVMVVPTLAKTFEELGVELPFTTRIIIGTAEFITERWYVFIGLLGGFGFLFYSLMKTNKGRKYFDRISLKLPVVSDLIKKTNTAGIIRTLSALIASGIPIVRALEIISATVSNSAFKNTLIEAIEKVRKGEKLSDSLSSYTDLYPQTVIQMMEVGEETGQTAEILEKLATFYEDEVSRSTQNLTA